MSVLVFRSFHGFSSATAAVARPPSPMTAGASADLVQTVAGAGGRLLFTGTAWPAEVWPFDDRT